MEVVHIDTYSGGQFLTETYYDILSSGIVTCELTDTPAAGNIQVGDSDEDILQEAHRLTSRDRQSQYGPPNIDFSRTARIWTVIFEDLLRPGVCFEAHHIAMGQIGLKLSRASHSPEKRDHWVDIAGYARCAWQCISTYSQEIFTRLKQLIRRAA